MTDTNSRSLNELANEAIDASQRPDRTLYLSPFEYGILVKQFQSPTNHVDGWDPIVFEIALSRGISIPLPDVRVVIK